MEDPLQVYRSLIQHEDTLRNQRLGWMLTATGFLFTALAFAWDADSLALVYVISVVGLLVALSTLVGLHTNQLAIADLRDQFAQHAAELRESGARPPGAAPPVVGMSDGRLQQHGLLRHDGIRRLFRALYPWRFIPAVIALAWLAVMVLAPIAEVGAAG